MTRSFAVVRWGIVLGAIGLLEILCRSGVIRQQVIIAPSQMVVSLVRILGDPTIIADIERTATEIAASFVSAVVVGFAVGVGLHALPRLRRAVSPLFTAYYAVPVFIFYPVFVAIFGLSTIPIILMGFALASVAMIVATLDALDRIPRVLNKLERLEQLGPVRGALLLKFPAAAPSLFGGIKLVVSYSFVAVIASEFIVSPGGLGYAISFAYNKFDNDTMYALILLVVVVVLAVTAILNRIERHIARAGSAANSVATDRRHARRTRFGPAPDVVLVILAIALVWQIVSSLVGDSALPSPRVVFSFLPGLLVSADFLRSAESTGLALLLAFALSTVIGICMGVGLGTNRRAAAVIEPILVSFYAIPKVVFYPIILLIFGIGMSDKVVFGVLHGFVPITLFSLNAVRNMRPVYRRMARSLDLSRLQSALTVTLPAALPQVVSGLRVGFSLTLLGILISELFAAKRGLGHLISQSTGIGDLVTTMSVATFLFVVAIAVDVALASSGRKLAKSIR